MEKTKENIDNALKNMLPTEEISLDYIPYIRDAYLNGEDSDVAHPVHGNLSDVDEVYGSFFQERLEDIFDRYKPNTKQIQEAEAETIIVKIGGREFKTYLDGHGTQRFRKNHLISQMVDRNTQPGSRGNKIDLNQVAMEYYAGTYSLEDYLDFYAATGYSVSGLLGFTEFGHLDVENPLWDNED
jgi:hypothetical protein